MKKIEEFYDFCVKVHQSIKCSDENCDFSLYIGSLKDAIDPDICCCHWRLCFVGQSMEYSSVFQIMFNVQKLGKEKVKNFIDHFLKYKL